MRARIQAAFERRAWLLPLAVVVASILVAVVLSGLGVPPPPLPGQPPMVR
jgi:hypothetical protein